MQPMREVEESRIRAMFLMPPDRANTMPR